MSKNDSLEIRRKRLYWRSTHRGIKEMDILMGQFAQQFLPHMDHDAMNDFERIIEMPDQELLSYFVEGAKPNPHDITSIFTQFMAFRPIITS